jgi:hypothetical protein
MCQAEFALLRKRMLAALKRAIVALYCHGVIGIRTAQWLIDALDLRGA